MKLVQILKAMMLVAPKNDVRYYLNGLQLKRVGDTVELNVTCGHMLVQVKFDNGKFDVDVPVDSNVVFDGSRLSAMLKTFNSKADPTIECNDCEWFIGDLKLSLIDGRYPDVNRVITKSTNKCDGIGLDMLKLSKLSNTLGKLVDHKFPSCEMKVRGSLDSVVFTREFPDYKFTGLLMPARL